MNTEILEYSEVSMVGIKKPFLNENVYEDDTIETLHHLIVQYQLLEEVTKELDIIAEQEDMFEERRKLEFYFIITSDYVFYGIDYNSGFFIPNNWDFITVESGLYSKIDVPNEDAYKHAEYLDAAVAYTTDNGFDLDDGVRPVIYKYIPVKEIENEDGSVSINYSLMINIPIK